MGYLSSLKIKMIYTELMLVDSHAHLEAVDDLGNVLKRAQSDGVNRIITIGTSLATSKKAIEIAKKSSADDLKIYATCGIHPQDGKAEVEKLSLHRCIDTLKQLAELSSKVIAIGECGLDYRMTTDPSTHSVNSVQASSGQAKQLTTDKEKEIQRELFEAQINLAQELKLPLVIHCRNAWSEIFDLLGKGPTLSKNKATSPLDGRFKGRTLRGVFHSWTGDWQAAKKALDLGFYISFSGIVTFKNAPAVLAAARKVPLESVLIETDSPFLSPEPLRSTPFDKTQGKQGKLGKGAQNEPKNVKIITAFLANLRNLAPAKMAQIINLNAKTLFNI